MKNIFLLFCCILLFNCNRKNENTQREILNYHNFSNIRLNNNSVIFKFIYNDENYKIMFHGKEIIVGFHISKNFVVDENIPPPMLDFDKNDERFIIDELNKSHIFNEINEKTINDINLIKISYKIYNINEVQNISVSIVPTDELVNCLIELIEIYYMPLYTVQENDTLSSICLKIYGSKNYEQIVKYNPGMKLFNQYLAVRPNEKIRIKLE